MKIASDTIGRDVLRINRRIKISVLILGLEFAIALPTLAQNITLDGTLGEAKTLTGPNYTIRQEDGQTVGNNLFHSFGRFGLDTGEAAIFQSNPNIQNILSRVTGGFPSFIDGMIKTESASVNLFLINPNGITFGPNASINIGGVNRGSFIATTADALVWSNGSQFSAINPGGSNSLLTIVGDPSGFLSSLRPSAPINASGSVLRVYNGQSIVLFGGDVTLNGGSLFAPGGKVELGGVEGEGIIGVNVDVNILSLSFPDNVTLRDVSLSNAAQVNVRAGEGGSIIINAQNLTLDGRSSLRAGIADRLGTIDAQAGDIEIKATEIITLDNGSFISNTVRPNAIGKGGNLNIMTGKLFMRNGAELVASTFGRGDAGNLTIHADDTVSLDRGRVFASVETGGVGQAGNLNITAGSLYVINGSQLLTRTLGQGNAGNINIDTRDTVFFDGIPSAAFSIVEMGAVGNSGNINITTGSLSVINGTQLLASTRGRGDAGSVNINARDTVSLQNGKVFASVDAGAVGNGGDINITTGSLSVVNTAQLIAATSGQGDAGNVNINARNTVSFDNSGAFSSVQSGAMGNGGDINITASILSVINGAQLLAVTLGQGNAGNITINVSNLTSFDGRNNKTNSSASSLVQNLAIGQGGDINITTGSLFVTNGGQINASTLGQGDAGNVNINVREVASLEGVDFKGFPSAISSIVNDGAVGKGGTISIVTQFFSVTNGAQLLTGTSGQGDAGNVEINASNSFTLSGIGSNNVASRIVASTEQGAEGQGGKITINTPLFRMTDGVVVNTQTRNAYQGGDITINSTTFEATNGAQLLTTARSSGQAGNITINATDSIVFSGSDPTFAARLAQIGDRFVVSQGASSGLFANTSSNSTGNGGNISINTQQLTIQNGATITASSSGTGNAGNIPNITARNLTLDNGSIATTSLSGNGGNIENLQVRDLLLLRNQSRISTTAGTQASGGGNGGNLNINAGFIVAVPNENSDITANAFEGSGGNITISTNGIFGLTFRNQLTPQSDITASSRFGINGIIAINTPDVNPLSALDTLPINPVDAERLVAQNICAIKDNKIAGGSSFIITGRGGLAPNPNETLTHLTGIVEWATNDRSQTRIETPVIIRSRPQTHQPEPITPIQGWVKNSDGTITLTTTAPTVTPQSLSFTPQDCRTAS